MVTRVNVNPEILIKFREDAGYYDINCLPKSLRENVIKWESGESKPTWVQLRKLGNKYKCPATFFLMNEVPKWIKEEFNDYRSLDESRKTKSPEFIYEIKRAIKRREIFLDIVETEDGVFSPLESIPITNNAEDLAHELRSLLNIPIDEQKSWIYPENSDRKDYKHYTALKEWKKVLESLNILIFETKDIEFNEMRGMAISEFPFPIILLNGSDKPNGRIFTLMHELVHIIKKQNSICDLKDKDMTEIFCNAVAGNILVPTKYLTSDSIVSDNYSLEWNEMDLSDLSHKFCVSKEVILRRLLTLNKTTKEFYTSKVKEWQNQRDDDTGGGGFDYRIILKQNGGLFTSRLLTAYKNKLITQIEFSRYMGGIKLKHIPDLQENIRRYH